MDEVSFPSHQDLDPLLDLLGIVSYLIITPPPLSAVTLQSQPGTLSPSAQEMTQHSKCNNDKTKPHHQRGGYY